MEHHNHFSNDLKDQGVHIISDFSGRTALCQVGRDLVDLVRQMELPVETLDLPLSPDRMKVAGKIDMSQVAYSKPKSKLSIISWNGDGNNLLAQQLPRELFKDRRIVGVWFWETESLPDHYAQGYDLVDEVWVTSKFMAESLSKDAPVPVKYIPHLLKHPSPSKSSRLPEFLCNERFTFLFCFDYRSVSKRKNPQAVCEAFTRAFPIQKSDGPLCVIKSTDGRPNHALEFAELRLKFKNRKDILFIDRWMAAEERDALMSRINCYVSLHRAEGLGLTLMECMALGKPCIATAYSGNMDFMTPDNSWLVPFRKVPIGPGLWPYPADHLWADPDLDAAAEAMVEVYSNPYLAGEKGLNAKKTMVENHGIERVSSIVKQTLVEAIDAPIRPKPALNVINSGDQHQYDQQISGRARAYQILKQSKELEQSLRQQCKGLDSWRLPPEVLKCITGLLDLTRLQQKAQTELLRDMGVLKKRIQGYHAAATHDLIRDQTLTKSIIISMLEDDLS